MCNGVHMDFIFMWEEPGKLRTNRLFLNILYPLVKNQCQGVLE